MRALMRCLLLCLFIWDGATAVQAQSKTTLVFIPGFAGSYLCERDSKVRVWPGKLDHYKLRLPIEHNLDPKSVQHEPCGAVREPIRLFGIRVSDVYGNFIKHLENNVAGGAKVLEYAYDWRLSVEHNARGLRAMLDKEAQGDTVDIVAHSFGGLVARYFIQNLGGENRVRQLITMGTPHRGSVDTFETLYEGWGGSGAGLKDSAINLWMGGPGELRKTLLTFPGFYDMLPNFDNCCWFSAPSYGNAKQFSAFDHKAWKRFSFYKDTFADAKQQAFLSFQLDRSLKLHRDTLNKTLPGVHKDRHRFVVTGWIDTATRVYVDERTGERLKFEKKQGDGTVPLYSATEGRDLGSRSLSYAPAEHMQIFMEKSALETVMRTIVGGIAPVGGAQLNFQIPAKDGRKINVRSLEFGVTPGAIGPGERLKLAVRFSGTAEVRGADFSNVTARIVSPGNAISTALELKMDTGGQEGALLVSEFSGPTSPGAYLVLIRIPGLADEYKDVFMVVEK